MYAAMSGGSSRGGGSSGEGSGSMYGAQPHAVSAQDRRRADDPVEEAKAAVDALLSSSRELETAVRGAVFLEDEEFRRAAHVAALRGSNRKLQQQVLRLREQVDSGQAALAQSAQRCKQLEDRAVRAEQQLTLMTTEQESTQRVFELHYSELMRRKLEVDELHAKNQQLHGIIDVLGGGKGDAPSTSGL